MVKQIFVNLPVRDLPRTRDFFTRLGFSFNPQFTDANAACMIIGENMYAMLLVEQYFATFSPHPVSDARQQTEVLIALQLESRAAVDAMVSQAIAAGGSAPLAAKDHGFMYQHGFQDPDGHMWEVFHMERMPS